MKTILPQHQGNPPSLLPMTRASEEILYHETWNQNVPTGSKQKLSGSGAGEMAQQLKALAALADDLGSILSTYMVANNHV